VLPHEDVMMRKCSRRSERRRLGPRCRSTIRSSRRLSPATPSRRRRAQRSSPASTGAGALLSSPRFLSSRFRVAPFCDAGAFLEDDVVYHVVWPAVKLAVRA
jgi:hypothetical protein